MTLRRLKMEKHFIFYDALHGSRRRPAQWPGTNVSKSGSRREYSSASTRHRTAFRLSASQGRRCLGRRCRANGKVCALGIQARHVACTKPCARVFSKIYVTTSVLPTSTITTITLRT
jgi:hypothetical protein